MFRFCAEPIAFYIRDFDILGVCYGVVLEQVSTEVCVLCWSSLVGSSVSILESVILLLRYA